VDAGTAVPALAEDEMDNRDHGNPMDDDGAEGQSHTGDQRQEESYSIWRRGHINYSLGSCRLTSNTSGFASGNGRRVICLYVSS
jgi:hypothetical protein